MASTKGLRAFQNARARKQSKAQAGSPPAAGPDAIFSQAVALHQAGEIGQAKILYQQLLAVRPDHAGALQYLAIAEFKTGNVESAEEMFRRALALAPPSADALTNFGLVFSKTGRHADALEQYDSALALDPDYAQAHCNRGIALNALERYEDATVAAARAVALKPNFSQAYDALALALLKLKRYGKALGSYAKAIELRPDYWQLYFNRATLFSDIKSHGEARKDYERALALNPDALEARLGLAKCLLTTKHPWDAIAECEKALAGHPNAHEAWTLLGQCREATTNLTEALACYDRALALKPDFVAAIQNRIFVLDMMPDVTTAQHQAARRDWWDRVGANLARPRQFSNSRDPNRRLVLGYVSGDFRAHSAAFVFGAVLRHHDHSRFDVVCYSNSSDEDELTREFKSCADRWRDIKDWSDERVEREIVADGVDILVDLSGHSAGNRLGVFARRPAPVQVTAWGHATGTGMPVMDYLLADKTLIPEAERALFAETIHDLPCALTLDPPGCAVAPDPPMLANGHVAYGVFNRIVKISDAALDVWAAILRADPAARMMIKHYTLSDEVVRQAILEKFAGRGIAEERIDLVDRSERQHHLATLGTQVDISLDPFPQNGGVSTWEPLHLGVPVIAKRGDTIASRVAAAILASIGYDEWIARDDDDYIRIALELARQPGRLKALRRELPARIAASDAGNPAAYTRAVETAYRAFWNKYCAGE